MLRKYFPSNKVIAFLVIPIVVIAFLIAWNAYLQSEEVVEKDGLSNTLSALNTSVDTDGDGLDDWEEDLVGTDKNKKDTDGDGFSDNLEIQTGSDPLDPLNKEKYKRDIEKELSSDVYNYRLDQELTNTDKMAIEFLEEGVKLKKAGLSFNKDAQAQVVNKIISQNSVDIDLSKYDMSDIKVSKTQSISGFILDFNNAVATFGAQKVVDETILLNDYLMNKDVKKLDQITYNVGVYEEYREKLLAIPVPQSISKEYLAFINALHAYIGVSSVYAQAEKDPVSVVQAMGVAKEIDENLRIKYENLVNKLK